MVASLEEKATRRKSFRANVRAVFDGRHKRNVIGKGSHRGLLVKIDSKADLQRMAEGVRSVKAGTASQDKLFGVAVIDDLQPFRPFVEDHLEGKNIKVKLVDYHDEQLNAQADRRMA